MEYAATTTTSENRLQGALKSGMRQVERFAAEREKCRARIAALATSTHPPERRSLLVQIENDSIDALTRDMRETMRVIGLAIKRNSGAE